MDRQLKFSPKKLVEEYRIEIYQRKKLEKE
jgi:hypothetical protein